MIQTNLGLPRYNILTNDAFYGSRGCSERTQHLDSKLFFLLTLLLYSAEYDYLLRSECDFVPTSNYTILRHSTGDTGLLDIL